MKLDMGEQTRERSVSHTIEDTIKEQKQDIKSGMKKERVLEETKISKEDPKWNISSVSESDRQLASMMSHMCLSQHQEKQLGVQALCRLVKRALAKADPGEAKQLTTLAEGRSKEEFVQCLRQILGKATAKDGELQTQCKEADQTTAQKATVQRCKETKNKKKGTLEGLKDDDDLCPRSPMRPHHQRTNNYLPYQNASRDHHSGGIMSTVAYSDPIAPTPQYSHLLSFQHLLPTASSPPLVVESSSAPCDIGLADLDNLSFSEDDMEVLMSIVADSCLKHPLDCEPLLPEPISQINSSQYDHSTNYFSEVDHQVPNNMAATQNIADDLFLPSESLPSSSPPWQGYNDDSTSGYSSLSPNSMTSFSPGGLSPDSRRVVPDESDVRTLATNMSPPRQFFDDNIPSTNYNLNVNIYAKDGGYCDAGFSPASSGYSSTNTPSPTEYPLANVNDPIPEDFDTTVRNASNDYFSSLDQDFLLPEFENVFDSETLDERSQTNLTTNSYNTLGTANIAANAHVYAPSENTSNHSSAHIPCANSFNNIPDLTKEVNNMSTTFTTLVNVSTDLPVQYNRNYTVPDSTPITINAPDIQLARPISKTSLKRLEPKVEHLLRAETGKERILQLMDPKKKAVAWVNISLKIKEVTQQDNEGDTQLMILCANTGGSVQDYALEYIYALVESLKGIPRALSAVNHQQHSALYLAAMHSDYTNRAIVVRYIAETLVELGEDIANTNEGGDTILHEVCQQGDLRYDVLVELLSLKNQAGGPYFDVNQYNTKGLTPLHVAVMSHGTNNVTCLRTVQLLMAERADILIPDTTHSYTALHLAILLKPCAPRLVKSLLAGGHSQGSACVNNTLNSKRDSPLHCAASRNDLPVKQQMTVIQHLLEHGAVKSLNASGKFPIALVAEERRQEIRRVYETRKGTMSMS